MNFLMNELRTNEQIHNDHRSFSEKLEERLREVRRAYRHVFEGVEGDRVLDDLKRWSRLEQCGFDESHARMAFSEGQREMVRYILKEVEKSKQGD